MNRTELAILIVTWNNADQIGECLRALSMPPPEGVDVHIVVVDNASSDDTATIVAEQFPHVQLIHAETNRGFTGGNNLGWSFIREQYPAIDYLVLLNPDTVVQPGWLEPLLTYMADHPKVAAVQPKLLLPDGRHIDTVGNRSHYLGFGYTVGHGEVDHGQYDEPRAIDFASGAAVMLRASLIREHGLFDEPMFMYLEDAELAWRWRLLGYETHSMPRSIVLHRHDPAATLQCHLMQLEKNRWWLLLSYYRWRTLIALLPVVLVTELGVFIWALLRGQGGDKCLAWRWLLSAPIRRALHEKRKTIQRLRTIGDRELTASFAARLETPMLNRGIVRWIVNPVLAGYWRLVRIMLRW